MDDAQAKVVLTDEDTYQDRQSRIDHMPDLAAMHWIAVDTISNDPNDWQRPAITPDNIAFLQYTSGSTGTPKGVMLSHFNLLSNLALIYKGFELSERSQGVSWLPPYHDMGLIGGILQPIYCHGWTVLMSPFAFCRSRFAGWMPSRGTRPRLAAHRTLLTNSAWTTFRPSSAPGWI